MQNPIRKNNRNELYVEDEHRLINQALADLSEADRKKVLEFVSLTKVDPDDPMFFAHLLVARCLVTVAPLPACMEQFQADLQGLKATAYEMRLSADRVSNLLREKTFSQAKSGIAVNSVIWYCLCSFVVGVVATIFLALVMAIAKNSLPPTSTILPPTNLIAF